MFWDVARRVKDENLFIKDRAIHFSNLLDNPSQLLSWDKVEDCINNTVFYEFEIIDGGEKAYISRQERAWVSNKEVQSSKEIARYISDGKTFIITNYGYHSRETQELLKVFESEFDVDCAMHAYGGIKGSKSFNIHNDFPPVFVFQIDGQTNWKVFKNRVSDLYLPSSYGQETISDEDLELDLEVLLKPGDALYIPSRCYHCASPDGRRLSISIPCWTKALNLNRSADRYYYHIQNLDTI